MTAPSAWLTLPNAISLGRLLLAPVALWLAYQGHGIVYKWLFAAALASDVADGVLARLMKAQTVLGSRLDAAADTATYLALFFATSRLWPEFVDAHLVLLATAFSLYALNHCFALLRFRRLPAYHSWAGKTSAVLMGAGMLVWFATGFAWIFTLAVIVSLVSVIEQFAITAILPHCAADVRTVYHAWKLRQATLASPGQPG